jgi:dihydroorotate dehydrogenase (NAD+) catalytic subunit
VSAAPDLSVSLGSLRLRNPVMVASGTFGYGPEYADLVDLNRLGALVVKGICLEPTSGNPPPRTVEVASGLINAIGLQNPGVDGFIRTTLPFLRRFTTPVIVNIWGRTVEEYAEVAHRFEAVDGIAALELNVSCPNIREGSRTFGTDPDLFRRVVAAVRMRTRRPLIPKLAPHAPDIAAFARMAEAEGADAVSLINSVPALAIDVEARRPVLGNVTGGLSGPAIFPLALKLVWEAARAVRIPVVGMGGISGPEQALAFLIAGASAVAVGTANFVHPPTALETVEGIRAYLVRHGMGTVRELVGSLAS